MKEKTFSVYSPDRTVQFKFTDAGGKGIRLAVIWNGENITSDSPFNLELEKFADFTAGMRVESIRMAEIREKLVPAGCGNFPLLNHCFENTWILRDKRSPSLRIHVILRAYNQGVAFRYRIPEQPPLETFRITGEETRWSFREDLTLWVPEAFAPDVLQPQSIPGKNMNRLRNWKMTLPVLVQLGSGKWAMATEAGTGLPLLTEMVTDQRFPHTLTLRGASRKGTPGEAGEGKAKRFSRWRVLLLGESPRDFLEGELGEKLGLFKQPSPVR